jgi:hypothetical protein
MEKCKYVIITGGDAVPYGATVAYLPDSYECDNPNVPDEFIDSDDFSCDSSCPYYITEEQ